PKVLFKKRKNVGGKGREQPVLEMSAGLLLYHQDSKGEKVSVALARWFLRPNDSGERTSPSKRNIGKVPYRPRGSRATVDWATSKPSLSSSTMNAWCGPRVGLRSSSRQ